MKVKWLRKPIHRQKSRQGFTLMEMLVASAIFLVLMGLTMVIVERIGALWRHSSDAIGEWQATRTGFESMVRRLSQATLDTTWTYFDKYGNITASDPARYGRFSQLQFVSGPANQLLTLPNLTTQAVFFQSPLGRTRELELQGLPALLNACGFYVQFNNDAVFRPDTLVFKNVEARWRFRLMELVEPSENLQVYQKPGADNRDWFQIPIDAAMARPLAENIIALIILPRFSSVDTAQSSLLAPNYGYNSRKNYTYNNKGIPGSTLHQLPPLLQVTMVALGDKSAIRLAQEFGDKMPPDLFTGAPFTDAAKYSEDMATLEQNLIRKNLSYRVFSSIIAVRGAKWSGDLP